jgi:hypothetical protein
MALRMMLQGRPGFQPNPMDLERETMKRQRGGLGAVLQALPRGGGPGNGIGHLVRSGQHGQLGASGLTHPSDIGRSMGQDPMRSFQPVQGGPQPRTADPGLLEQRLRQMRAFQQQRRSAPSRWI